MGNTVTAAPVRRDADISADGLYRYSLTRSWGSAASLVFVMLNPSTADATVDDPTIRRCMGFARREGAGGIVVVNLYALRATDPRALVTASDPVGPRNDEAIANAARGASRVIAAWGTSMPAEGRPRVDVVRFMLTGITDLHSLSSLTNGGQPRHPLYIAADAPLVLYRAKRSTAVAHV